MNIKRMKKSSLKKLKGNYGVMISCVLIFLIMTVCCNIIAKAAHAEWITSILLLIFGSLIYIGYIDITIKIAEGRKPKINLLLEQTDSFGKCMLITIILSWIVFIFLALELFSFQSLVIVLQNAAGTNFALLALLVIFGLILSTIVIMLALYIMISFSLVFYILRDEPKLSVLKIFSKSFDMMNGYVIDYFILALSFAGWFILGIFTFGLLYIWLIPYVHVVFAQFYKKVKKCYEEHSGADGPLDLIADEAKIQAETT